MISAVERAMEILEALCGDPRGATVTELVDRLGIEKSIVSRVLATLEQGGYIVRDPQANTFRLALRFVGIALRHFERVELWDVCMPVLRRLSESTNELVQLAVVDGDGLIYVAKAEGTQRIRAQSVVGTRSILHASTAGRVWLASLPEARVIQLIGRSGLGKITPKTIDSFDRLRLELARVRKQGYSMIFEELLEAANGVGVPIRNAVGGAVIGAVIVGGPAFRFKREQMERALPEMVEAAAELGRGLAAGTPRELVEHTRLAGAD